MSDHTGGYGERYNRLSYADDYVGVIREPIADGVDRGDGAITDGGLSDPGGRIYCDKCRKFRAYDHGKCHVCGSQLKNGGNR